MKKFISLPLCLIILSVGVLEARAFDIGHITDTIPLPYSKQLISHKKIGSSSKVGIISTKTRGIMGDMAEANMDRFFQGSGKYTKIASQVGNKGVDGLYVRYEKGNPKVLVVESKYNLSQLNQSTKKGPQMSRKWILESIDEKISNLSKNPQNAQVKKEIEQLKKVREVVKSGAYRRRIFHSEIQNGKMVITLSAVEEYTDKTGKIRTRKKPPRNITTGKSGIRWKVTSKGEQLKIPLSDREYGRAIKKMKYSDSRYLSEQRKKFYNHLDAHLKKGGLTAEETKEIKKKMQKGEIANSKDLNRAVDNKLYSSKRIGSTLSKSKTNLTKNQISRIEHLAKKPIVGNPKALKTIIEYQIKLNNIKKGLRTTITSVKNYRQTTKSAVNALKKINTKTVKECFKNPKVWKAAGKGTLKGVVIVTIALEVYNNTKYWNEYSRGLHTKKEAYVFASSSVSILAAASAGAWAGAQIGAFCGSSVPIVGTTIGSIAGGVVGGSAGALTGYFAGNIVGEQAYNALHYLEDEKLRQDYVMELKEYCQKGI